MSERRPVYEPFRERHPELRKWLYHVGGTLAVFAVITVLVLLVIGILALGNNVHGAFRILLVPLAAVVIGTLMWITEEM